MNKKGFTLIELIAVVVIMAIIALLATPNIVNMMDEGKRNDYVADAKEIISKATYMYKQKNVREDYKQKFDNNKIQLKNIKGINSDFKDPYGFDYDQESSYVRFEEPDSSGTGGLAERTVYIALMSHNGTENGAECYTIDNYKNKLDKDEVKQGTWVGTGCEITK